MVETIDTVNNTGENMDIILFQNITYYIEGIVAVVVIILGLIGNFLTVIVLTRPTMHSSTNIFLTGLAIWDMIVLCGTLVLITLPELSKAYFSEVLPYIVVYIYPIALIAQTTTVWITVSFTVERYIAVCHPLRATSMCTTARARVVIAIVSICAVLFNLCRWFEFKIIETSETTSQNTTIHKTSFSKTDFGESDIFKKIYYLYFYPFVMLIVPLSLLAILNTFLVHAVKRSRKQQITMNVRQSRENNVTLMLVSVVIVFMICQVPALVYNIAYSINETSVEAFGWKVLSSIRNFLVTFNSAINFLLYCAFGQKFRVIFIRTFCRRLLRENDFNSFSCPGTTRIVTKLDNKKYKTMLMKQGNCLELSSTHQTHVSRYSPYNSRTPSPQTGANRRIRNGLGNELHPDSDYSCNTRLLAGQTGSRTPSPTYNDHTPS
ncbi:FMRFamide receptor-like [Ruditapes philippinarum]|uniref:FMRFamide receptor-like n=1 Tax=Ruditapes philippinarum TaxID=129788 RepID=UPI00295B2567|nr:FMRFamide receptor-like [Ruditapes philippinarum]